ncbi:MAG: hypothetical protein HZA34_00555 [Candidatus Pacebacteria bacterium]|nr:hypothetical protein [Candidatus Paceibacterota bacterium]
MLTMREKASLTTTIRMRYHRASKTEKTIILDEFVESCGYNRSYARRVLGQIHPTCDGRKKKRTQVRTHQYDYAVFLPLRTCWLAAGWICGKRLHPFLPELIPILEKNKELKLTAPIRRKLLTMSRSTIDRMLAATKKRYALKGRSTTKPGTLLKNQIQIRTFADWEDKKPGFFEIDGVAFCGENPQGHYVYGLNFTDVCLQWIGLEAVMGKGQFGIHEAVQRIQTRLPFPILGIDSDNGSEFINDIMLRFCENNHITFTRIRAGRKNENCYVEQKNYTVLRNFVGYGRYETEEQLKIIQELLKCVEVYVNFFQPSQKLLKKVRVGSKVMKTYDQARTPYQRLRESDMLKPNQQQTLRHVYEGLNPMDLQRNIHALQTKLMHTHRYKNDEATNMEFRYIIT